VRHGLSVIAMVVVASIPSLASADALAPGERAIQHTFKVRGAGSFGDWQIVLYPHGTSGGAPDEPVALYIEDGERPMYEGRWHSPRFYAIPVAVANEVRAMRGDALRQFLDTDPRVARGPSDVHVVTMRAVQESSGITAIEDIYTVSAIEGNTMRVEVTRNTTRDGERETHRGPGATSNENLQNDDDCNVSSARPERVGLLLVLLAVGGALIVRARRRLKD
jgi:hypothetical protein